MAMAVKGSRATPRRPLRFRDVNPATNEDQMDLKTSAAKRDAKACPHCGQMMPMGKKAWKG